MGKVLIVAKQEQNVKKENVAVKPKSGRKWRKRIFYVFLITVLFAAFYYLVFNFGKKPEFTSLIGEMAIASFVLMIITAFIIIPLKGRSQEKAKKIGQILILTMIFFGTYFLMAVAANAEPDAAFFVALVAVILALLIALILKVFESFLWFLADLLVIFALIPGAIKGDIVSLIIMMPALLYVIVYIVIFPLKVLGFIENLIKKIIGAIKFIFSPFLKITSRNEPKK